MSTAWLRVWVATLALGVLAFCAATSPNAMRAPTSLVLWLALSQAVLAALLVYLLGLASEAMAKLIGRSSALRAGVSTALPILLVGLASASIVGALYVDYRLYRAMGRHMGELELSVIGQRSMLVHLGVGTEAIRLAGAAVGALAAGLVALAWLARRRIRRLPRGLWALTACVGLAGLCSEKLVALSTKSQRFVHAQALVPYYIWPRRQQAATLAGYPRGLYHKVAVRQRPNVLIVVIESFRPDAISPRVMPFLDRYRQQAFEATAHHANSDCTHYGLLSLLYASNPSISAAVGRKHSGSLPVGWLRQHGYRTRWFSSQPMSWLGIREVVLAPNFDQIVEIPLTTSAVWLRDAELIDQYLRQLPGDQPHFDVLMLHSTHHDYDYPPHAERFRPVIAASDILLKADHRPHLQAIRNRYHNAAAYIDTLLERLLRRVPADTVVAITGDHGEAMLEHGYLLHARAVAFEETNTPLVISGIPTLRGQYARVSGAEQLMPTILEHLAPGLNHWAAGTGRPLGSEDAWPLLAATCGPQLGQPIPIGHRWVALFPDRRIEFSLAASGVVAFDDTPSVAVSAAILRQLSDVRPATCSVWRTGAALFHLCSVASSAMQAARHCQAAGARLARSAEIDPRAHRGLGSIWVGGPRGCMALGTNHPVPCDEPRRFVCRSADARLIAEPPHGLIRGRVDLSAFSTRQWQARVTVQAHIGRWPVASWEAVVSVPSKDPLHFVVRVPVGTLQVQAEVNSPSGRTPLVTARVAAGQVTHVELRPRQK